MSKTDNMAKLPGLHKRAGVYQLRVVIPLDLRAVYGSRTKVIRSLLTSDPREAAITGAKSRAQQLQEFEDRRRALNPQPVATLTPDLGRILGQRIRDSILQGSMDLRTNGAALLSEIAGLIPSPGDGLTIAGSLRADAPATSPLDGLTDAQLATLAGLNAAKDGAAAMQLAAMRLSAVVPLADGHARKLGMLVNWKAPEARPVLLECLQAYREAWADIGRLDVGTPIPVRQAATEQSAVRQATGAGLTLRDIFNRWMPSKPTRKRASNRACELALILFEKQYGDMPVQQITREQGDAFRSWLLQQGASSKTTRDRFTWIKTLLLYAHRDLEILARQPWARLDIAHRTEARRRPWRLPELQALFGLPIFTEYAVPTTTRSGTDAAYWIPLLALFSGATVSELAQIRTQDIDTTPGSPTFKVTDEGAGMSAKNEHRVREVPVHSELVRLGFIEYVGAIRQRGSVSLWPALSLRKDKPGGYFSEWFGELRKAAPVSLGKYPDFHCFRHSARSAMAEAQFENSVLDRITGHTVKGSAGTRVYQHPTEILRKAVEAITYPGLHLPKVFTRPAFLPQLGSIP